MYAGWIGHPQPTRRIVYEEQKQGIVDLGALAGAVLGVAFAWVASDGKNESGEGEAIQLKPTDYFQLGIGLLTLARQFGVMWERIYPASG